MGILKKLVKGAVDAAGIPVAVVKDVATLGGTLTDRDMPGDDTYTVEQLKKIRKTGKSIYVELDD